MPKAKAKHPKVQAHLYFDPAFYQWLKKQAQANGRTLQGEVTWRLNQQREAERAA